MSEFAIIGGVIAMGFAAIFGISMAGYVLLDQPSCHAKWEHSGHQTSWDFWGGCKVEMDGKFYPEEAVKRIEK